MEAIATVLKVLGHTDRLRIVALLSEGELTVSELVQVLDLSQPRVTQYIKSLEAAGIIERFREGSWVFSRLQRSSAKTTHIVAASLSALPQDDTVLEIDRRALKQVRALRAAQSEQFFTDVANDRHQLGHEYLPQADIETAMLSLVGETTFDFMVDLGTGTGRMLEVFAAHVRSGVGIDSSPAMLKVARHKLAADDFAHLSVQQSDLLETPIADGRADLVSLHQVLHYLDDPALALFEAARLLKPGGTLIVADFEAHEHEIYRESFAHRRLGFSEAEILKYLSDTGFTLVSDTTLDAGQADRPPVRLWQASRLPHAATSQGRLT